MAIIQSKNRRSSRRQRGMTIIELMIAMVVLSVGILGCMNLVAVAMAGNQRSRQQSNSTALAQMVTERIMAVPANFDTTVTITDCTNTSYNVNTAAGGGSLTSYGDLDYTQAKVTNYNMPYVDCGTQGRAVTYDVRWNVQTISSFTKLLTVSARVNNYGNSGLIFSPVVTIHTIVGQGT